MQNLYDHPDIYDLLETKERFNIVKKHWEEVLRDKNVSTLLDVSIGTGNLTLPLAEMGVHLSGSDLSGKMLDKCRQKACELGIEIELRVSDFRHVRQNFNEQFDCVVSTGNALPYVPNEDIIKTLGQMDSLVKEGGFLCFDTRNWDKILQERPRFYLYNPAFDGDTRINTMQVWDYNNDGSMTFHLLYTFEKDAVIFRREQFEEHYFPVSQKLLLETLVLLGYENIQVLPFPAMAKGKDPAQFEWYCVIAQKC